ncbi:MAG: hypothetical protein ACK4RZ_13560 [Paracoccaceae bacterium]
MKHGPTRGEWWFRLVVSLGGLGLLALTIALRGWPEGPGLVEVVGFGGLFFVGSAVMALRGLLRRQT